MATFRKTDSSPATKFAEITKSDSTVYDPAPSAIYVGGAGDIEITGVEHYLELRFNSFTTTEDK